MQNRYDLYRSLLMRKEIARSAAIYHREMIEQDIVSDESDIEILIKVNQVLRKLLEDLAQENLSPMDKIVTEGLRRVFFDQEDIVFKSELVDTAKQLQIKFKTEQGDVSGKSLDNFGASVTVVESLLLRILVLLKMKLAPVLLLDEAMAQVSDQYVEPLGRLIKKLCKDLGLTVLLVTHKKGFQDTADIVYQADVRESDTVRTLILKRVKDEIYNND